jgi:hypothetical protein
MNYLFVRTEALNLITGLLLVISGLINLSTGNFEMGMNWIIFGAMYLIMDDYMQNPNYRTLLEKTTDLSRIIFSWVGFIASIVLLFYYLSIGI